MYIKRTLVHTPNRSTHTTSKCKNHNKTSIEVFNAGLVVFSPVADPDNWSRGGEFLASAEREPIMGVLGASPWAGGQGTFSRPETDNFNK